ncbi:MAG: hypothetical protein U9N42_02095, partial [Campylobacterota bacterium]|nr:hypothetical protein [Campylobacterota bacterium]
QLLPHSCQHRHSLKVSQQFKSPQGAKDYATLRSIIDTARKRDMNEFETIRDIFGGESVF